MEQELKETLSVMRKEGYRLNASRARDLLELKLIKLEVITDNGLLPNHREQLLRYIEGAIHGPEFEVGRRSQTETRVKVELKLSS